MRRVYTVILLGLTLVFIYLYDDSAFLRIVEHAPTATTTSPASLETVTEAAELDLARVIRVIDGDTIVLDIEGATTTVRLIGLNTPETVDPRRTVECFGKEASQKARDLLTDAFVRVEYDPSQGRTDKYGRTLAYIYLENGTFFNKHMIAEGYGHEYTYAIPYAYQSEFKAAEKSAREQKKGLWADGACSA